MTIEPGSGIMPGFERSGRHISRTPGIEINMNINDEHGTTILRRATEHKPRLSLQSWLIGRPLQTADAPHQTIGKLVGLAVFASDALSSTAYATQEMLVILAAAGTVAFGYAFPISIAIVALLAILTLSYRQIIHAYPGGGGAYIVARDNLGELPALVAAAALLTDYVLTVSVSISSGVAQIISSYPSLFEYRVWISVALVLGVMVLNLRGVKESGMTLAIPSYFFILMMYLTVGTGLVRFFLGSLGEVVDPPPMHLLETTQPLTILLFLRAFSSGTSAVTGVEAISNGITAFKEPRSVNAAKTLQWMSLILGTLLLGITFLANHIVAVPSEQETVISQLARTVYGDRNLIYLLTITATTVILVLAANTAFAGFPRLGAITATDGYIPRQMAYRGSRLVYSRGIVALAVVACLFIIIFQASVTRLIPLYAIGVFMTFTLSQAGMARRWWKAGRLKVGEVVKEHGSTLRFDAQWVPKALVNGVGASITFFVMVMFAITRFTEGAFIIILIIPVLVLIFAAIHRHYVKLAGKLSLENYGAPPRNARNRVILTLGGVHRGSLAALRYAHMLSDDITAVHVSIDPDETARLQKKWEQWGDGYRLVILDSPYRLFIEPLLDYIESLSEQLQANEVLTVIVPQFVSRSKMSAFLHTRTADTLRAELLNRKNVVISEVPYQVD